MKQKKDKGAWVVHPKSGHRGVVDHTYDDNVNEHGRLVQVDYGAKKVNHREFHIAHSKDQKSKWADKPSESGFSAAAPAPAVGGPSYESKNHHNGRGKTTAALAKIKSQGVKSVGSQPVHTGNDDTGHEPYAVPGLSACCGGAIAISNQCGNPC